MTEEGSEGALLRRVIADLERFARDGKERWKAMEGSRLSAVESLPGIKVEIEAEHQPKVVVICDALEDSCKRLQGDWAEAAVQHMGHVAGAPRSKVRREEKAAKKLSYSLRTYRATRTEGRHRGREYRGRVFDSWAEVTLTLIAEALIDRYGEAASNGMVGRASSGERRLGDAVRAEIAGFYRSATPDDFDVSFFHRPSTNAYVEDLASLEAVTLHTGGALSAEVHAELSDKLMARSLRERLRSIATDLNEAQRRRVVDALMHAYPPSHLGSVVREFVRQHSKAASDDIEGLEQEAQEIFALELRDGIAAGRDTGAFLALGVGALAFALRRAGRSPVRVMTTNYDDRMSEVSERVHEYFRELDGYTFSPLALGSREDVGRDSVPLYSLNGHVRGGDPLIIGEADALTGHYEARSGLVDTALSESACVFVGSGLTDPDVLAKLVTAPYPEELPRYAIILAPDLDLDTHSEKAKAINLAAKRFVHLGVVPIVIDFPHQAPQFLIEVALRLQQGGEYRDYANRLQTWWDCWAEDFGFGHDRAGRRSRYLQEAWMAELAEVRDRVAGTHLGLLGGSRDSEEQVQVEVWLRHPEERSLVLWASSDGLWLNSNSAPRCYIHKGEDVPVQRAFREGTPVHGRAKRTRQRWRYQLSIPLVLRKHPWHHLPVGVANVTSSEGPPVEDENGDVIREGGRLAAFPKRESFGADLAGLTSTIKRRVNELLDPCSSLCRHRGLGRDPDSVGRDE